MKIEDVYWLSSEGRLLGMIPCLGIRSGPHSFCTKFLEHKSSIGKMKIVLEHTF